MSDNKIFSIFIKIPAKNTKVISIRDTAADDDSKLTADTTNNSIEYDVNILSIEQKYAFDKYKNGDNIFLTGPGGTGKTRLIQYFIQYSKSKEHKFQVCAMTGCAAILLNCNARTIHSWSGIKLAKGPKSTVINSVINNRNAVRNWKKAHILILDEVSMLSKKIFEIIEEIARIVKKNHLPFGGMQVIFSGDFCQLPPVGNYGEPDTSNFCFESPIWHNLFPNQNCVHLKTIFRQTDSTYTNILHGIRIGVLSQDNCNILKKCVGKTFDTEKHNGCVPTKLFPLRSKADYVNKIMFSKLSGDDHVFNVVKKTDNNIYVENSKPIPLAIIQSSNKLTAQQLDFELNNLINNTPCVQSLHLKIGAAVMCTVNLDMDNSICNGSQGIIIDIYHNKEYFIPVVRFSNGIIKHIHPHYWQSDDFPTVSIGQYPLCLAWALTIHKIQGATLQLAEIDVGNSVFEYGQTYVALSRVQSLEGLYLSAFEPDKIEINPNVAAFYRNIPDTAAAAKLPSIDNNSDDPNVKRIKL